MHVRRLGAVPYLLGLDLREVLSFPTERKMCRVVKEAHHPPIDLQV